MKTLSLHIRNKALAQEAINCWLRYTFSQPISIDISMLVIFAVQYFGLTRIMFLFEHVHKLTTSAFRIVSEALLLNEPLAYGLEQARLQT